MTSALLYLGSYGGQEVLIDRQIDDFLAAGLDEEPLRDLFQYLATKINIVAEIGIVSHYSGIEIVQDRDYVKIHVGKTLARSWRIMDGNREQKRSHVSLSPCTPVH
jgi:hypothetical protein